MLAFSFGMIAAMRLLFGLFSAFASPIAYSLIADYFPLKLELKQMLVTLPLHS
jgi:MFS family permease